MNKEILNKKQKEEDYPVKVSFEVVCHSHTSMNDGDTLKQRIFDYIDQCSDAMDDSMRHWGDHYHDIEPVKVELYDDDEKSINVTNEVLGKINPDLIPEILNNLIKNIKKYVIELNNSIPNLMECPDELPSRNKISEGKYLHTDESRYGDPTYWIYPEGIEEKIEDDKKYKVWYTSRDAADPADSTTWNYIKYIQYIPTEKLEIGKELENIKHILTFGK